MKLDWVIMVKMHSMTDLDTAQSLKVEVSDEDSHELSIKLSSLSTLTFSSSLFALYFWTMCFFSSFFEQDLLQSLFMLLQMFIHNICLTLA